MFLRFYGFREQPFGMTPDPRLLYLSASHREALASLLYGIETGRGFMAMIAEPGMGKTTLLFQLIEKIRDSARTAFLFQTEGTGREFLASLVSDLGFDPGDRDLPRLHSQLNEVLMQESRAGKQFVLVIDEAQNLDDSVLESVRMLSNFETTRRKLIQIVLAGQPPLADKLAKADLEQLKQRVSIVCRLEPFTENDVSRYVTHRLEAAGYKGRLLFTAEALSIVAAHSRGIPRNINNLCFHALSLGYARQRKQIDASIMAEVLKDLDLDSLRGSGSRARNVAPPIDRHDARRGFDEVALRGGPLSGTLEPRVQWNADFRLPARDTDSFRHRRPSGGSTRGLAWAFTLLAVVFVAETYLFSGSAAFSRKAIAQYFSTAVHAARVMAAKRGLAQPPPPDSSEGGRPSGGQLQTANSNTKSHDRAQSPEGSSDAGTANATQPAGTPAQSVDTDLSAAQGVPAASEPLEPEAGAPPASMGSGNSTTGRTSGARGKVLVESNFADSRITINGRTSSGWRVPHVFSLAPGTYRIAVSRPGYSTWFTKVRVARGRTKEVWANLVTPRGVILIDTRPRGLEVYIDGRHYGRSEIEARLRPGAHTYKIMPPSGQPLVGTFFLRPGAIVSRTITCPVANAPTAEENSLAPGERLLAGPKKEKRG